MPRSPSITPFRVLGSHFGYPALILPSEIYTLDLQEHCPSCDMGQKIVLCSHVGQSNSFDYFSFLGNKNPINHVTIPLPSLLWLPPSTPLMER